MQADAMSSHPYPFPPPATRGCHPPPVSATLPLMCSQPPTA